MKHIVQDGSSVISERDLGFLEGLIDGEGYIGLNKAKSKTCRRGFQWKPVLCVSNNSYPLLRKMKRICDYGHFVRKGGKNREFRLNSKKMKEILPQLELVGKKRQAELIIRAIQLIEQNKRRKKFEKPINDYELEKIHNQIKKLNCNKKAFRVIRRQLIDGGA